MWHVVEKKSVLKQVQKLPDAQKGRYALWQKLVEEFGPEKLRENPGRWNDHTLGGELEGQRASWLGSRNWRVRYRVEKTKNLVGVEKVGKHEDVYIPNRKVSRPRRTVIFSEEGPWYPATEIEMDPGELVAEMRKLLGWTQRELAEKSGVAQPHVSAIERGKLELGLLRARKLGAAMGVPPRFFLG